MEAEHIARAVALHRQTTGARPLGFYQGRASMNTVALGCEEGGFVYLADSYADELPYWIEHRGRPQLVTRYTLDANDMRVANGGFADGEEFFRYLRDGFDLLLLEGREGHARMFLIGLHCRLAGRPPRAEGLRRFLDHARARQDVWCESRPDIARHWIATHPFTPRARPSRKDRTSFLARFAPARHGARWLAERVFAGEPGAVHDEAAGLGSAFAQAFRAADPTLRRAALAGAEEEGERDWLSRLSERLTAATKA
jgi:hypothetical protein